MKIDYVASEMGFEGKFPTDYQYMRVFETQIHHLDAIHLPVIKILEDDKVYGGNLLWNIGKGGFDKPYINLMYTKYHNTVELLKQKFDKVTIYQDGEIGWWNNVDVKLQVWWFNQLSTADRIFVPNESDVKFYKGLFNTDISVIRSVQLDDLIDVSILQPKEHRTIISGPFTYEYNGFIQTIIAHNFGAPIDVPPMGKDRMPKDSWEMSDNVGVNYLEYMTWTQWIHNLNKYSLGIMMTNATASASFALNCASLAIPCIGDERADVMKICFPELCVNHFDTKKAVELAIKLKTDKNFYKLVSTNGLSKYRKHFTKEKMLETMEKVY